MPTAKRFSSTLWITEQFYGYIGEISSSGASIGQFKVPGNNPSPISITVDSSGNLWFSETGNDAQIGELNPTTGQFTMYNLPTGAKTAGITVGPDGNIWFTDQGNKAIGVLNIGGAGGTPTTPSPTPSPTSTGTGSGSSTGGGGGTIVGSGGGVTVVSTTLTPPPSPVPIAVVPENGHGGHKRPIVSPIHNRPHRKPHLGRRPVKATHKHPKVQHLPFHAPTKTLPSSLRHHGLVVIGTFADLARPRG